MLPAGANKTQVEFQVVPRDALLGLFIHLDGVGDPGVSGFLEPHVT